MKSMAQRLTGMGLSSVVQKSITKRVAEKRRLKGDLVVRAGKGKYEASNYCGEDATYPFRRPVDLYFVSKSPSSPMTLGAVQYHGIHANDTAGASSEQSRKNEPRIISCMFIISCGLYVINY